MDCQQAELDTRERESVNAAELVSEPSIPNGVYPVVEFDGGREQHSEFTDPCRELIDRQERGQDHEAKVVPGS